MQQVTRNAMTIQKYCITPEDELANIPLYARAKEGSPSKRSSAIPTKTISESNSNQTPQTVTDGGIASGVVTDQATPGYCSRYCDDSPPSVQSAS
jgi:hypothetical protein